MVKIQKISETEHRLDFTEFDISKNIVNVLKRVNEVAFMLYFSELVQQMLLKESF